MTPRRAGARNHRAGRRLCGADLNSPGEGIYGVDLDGNATFANPARVRGAAMGAMVGTSKFAYDLWGGAINVASRIESSGVAGRIQVAEASFERLQDRYEFEPRGEIQVKGRGEMHTWFLEGPA